MKCSRFLFLGLTMALVNSARGEVTYAKQVSRIIAERCQTCHRAGDIAPFALNGYQDAVDYAADIKRVVAEGIMPPWKPTEGHGKFRGSFALKPEEKMDLLSWIDAGTPFGDEADLPEAKAPAGDWALGEPDLVVKMPRAFSPAKGKDVYRCFVLPTGLSEDKFVSAVDILPGNRRIVHHAIVYLDSSGEAEKLDALDEEPGYDCYGGPGFEVNITSITSLLLNGYTLGGWAPGARAHHLPSGVGMQLGRRARIVLQVHYYTGGRTGEDQTSIGLYFNKEEVKRPLYYIPVVQTRLNIKAGDPASVATAELPNIFVPQLTVIDVFPHMHLLGTKIRVEKEFRGDRELMIEIDKWDFNWQGSYQFVEPVSIPLLGRVRLRCEYDNSVNNPRNPSNPLKDVRWGEGTEDEMCLAFLGVTLGPL